jgi:hypothetical protein
MSKLVTRRVRRGRYVKRSRCGGKRSRRKGYNKKHYTRKYGKQSQRLRQTRKKVGGTGKNLGSFNFVLPQKDPRFANIEIQGQGWVYVTKLGSLLSGTNIPEQIIIYKKLGNVTGNYFIARCVYDTCNHGINMKSKILETPGFNLVTGSTNDQRKVVLHFTTTPSQQDRYRIRFTDKDNQRCFSDDKWFPDIKDKSLPAFYIKEFTGRQQVIYESEVAQQHDPSKVAQQPNPSDGSNGFNYSETT